MNEIIQKILPELKKYWFIPVMILAGLVLMTVDVKKEDTAALAVIDDDRKYVEETEARLIEMLKGIEGAGECTVTITLSSGGKKEYVREEGNVLVISDKDGNESAVLSKQNVPDIAGVTVASKGAGSLTVRNRIIESVSTVLGIGTNKICVVLLSG